MSKQPVAAFALCFAIFCAVTIAISQSANAQPAGSGPAVQQGETAGVQTTPKETQAKPRGAQAKPDVPQAENSPIASGSLVNSANVRFDVTISYQTGTQAPVVRTAMLTVADGTGLVGRSASLRANNQVPVPNTTFVQAEKPDGSAAKPVTSYTYRSIGLNLDVRDVQVHANRVKAVLGVEFSAVDEPPAGSPLAPSFPTFQQNFSLVFENGKPILVAQSSVQIDRVERVQKLEIKATILR